MALCGRQAFKVFGSKEAFENVVGSRPRRIAGGKIDQVVVKGEGGFAKDLEIESDGEDLVDCLDELTIAAHDHAQ